MNIKQHDQRLIGEIWYSIERLQRCVREGAISQSFLVNPHNEIEELAAYGVVFNVRRILEEVVALSDGTKVSFPSYEWNEIRGMRNRLVHDYSGTDFDFVWDAIQTEIPKLRQLCLDYCALNGLSIEQIAPDDQPRKSYQAS